MTELVLNILNKLGIEEYNIYEEKRSSAELFFIKRNLDLKRSKEVTEVRLRIYRSFEEFKGSSDVFIYPGMDEGELEEKIKNAYESAGYIKNPKYELAPGIKDTVISHDEPLMENAIKLANALYSAKESESAFINSAEIFANRKDARIITSSGTDLSFTTYSYEGEFVVQCVENGEDVELYNSFEYDKPDCDALTCRAEDALLMARDRAKAVKSDLDFTNYPIILTDENVGELLSFFVDRANAAYCYPKYSPYEKGYRVQTGDTGELISITGTPKEPYSTEGVKMVDTLLFKDGVVENIHGSLPFLSYLGQEQIGNFTAFNCHNGTKTMDELCQGKYIMVKKFSDFQVDKFDGSFGGEFRLAYLCDGENKSVITGGTVTGNIFEMADKMVFSKERFNNGGYTGPKAVRIG